MNFIRLNVTAEGQTEERFVKRAITPHLGAYNISTSVRRVLTSKDKKLCKEHRGGFIGCQPYSTAKKDIEAWLKEDNNSDSRFTTMFDLYALPKGFPGYDDALRKIDKYERVKLLEKTLAEDIDDHRFLPYIQLHEFEALILADPQKLEWEYLEHKVAIDALISIVSREGGNPELINDRQDTCPSRRIIAEIPEYSKATSGPIVAEKIGIQKLREGCRHFGEWLTKLERLGQV